MITGSYDYYAYRDHPELCAQAPQKTLTITKCAHLFSESALAGDKVVSTSYARSFLIVFMDSEYASSALAILNMLGLGDVDTKLLGSNVNSFFNVLTMSSHFHELFDHFEFWLEEVPNQVGSCSGHIITFDTHKRICFSQIPM